MVVAMVVVMVVMMIMMMNRDIFKAMETMVIGVSRGMSLLIMMMMDVVTL